jgi:quinol monooxygenase YgiN/heme-degrading monooxygenase HmoA
MKELQLELPHFMKDPILIGEEVSITGKWTPKSRGGIFRRSHDSEEMVQEWEDIHKDARSHKGMLSTEINHAIGQDAVLVHHIFQNEEALAAYFTQTAGEHAEALHKVAKPDYHLIRGMKISDVTRSALQDKGVNGTFGQYLYGFVKNDYHQPDPLKAIQVTAKWACKPGESLEELQHWWLKVGTDAYDAEAGMIRFEVYQVIEENALIIHETFESSDDLKFHLTKGMAARYKKDIDKIAAPENYFFRGPVSWTIRTYSKFMGLPATYSSRGSHYTQQSGTMSEGIINHKINNKMENQKVMVVYSWTAKEGKSEELKAIYTEVTDQMNANEPGALKVQCYFDESTSRLIVLDVFKDAGAVGFHLGTTAAGHFERLLAIANPGEFLFCGDVPDEMKAAATGMGLDATFAPAILGFERN